MLFDIKMEDFRCKARLVAGGHMTQEKAFVSRETVRIVLMITKLNDLEVKSHDILNAYDSPYHTKGMDYFRT